MIPAPVNNIESRPGRRQRWRQAAALEILQRFHRYRCATVYTCLPRECIVFGVISSAYVKVSKGTGIRDQIEGSKS